MNPQHRKIAKLAYKVADRHVAMKIQDPPPFHAFTHAARCDFDAVVREYRKLRRPLSLTQRIKAGYIFRRKLALLRQALDLMESHTGHLEAKAILLGRRGNLARTIYKAICDAVDDGFKVKGTTLIKETDEITLWDEGHGYDLGQFLVEIELYSNIVQVIALQSNTPSEDSSVTHPHVRDNALCMGESKDFIENCLISYHYGDAFDMIETTLQNYNRDSAYVTLEDWNAASCYICEDSISEAIDCDDCGTSVCRSCCTEYDGEWICDHCVSRCDDCRNYFPTNNLNDGRCDGCQEKREEQEQQEARLEDEAAAQDTPKEHEHATAHN